MSEVEYRCFRPGDEAAINEGFNRVFGTDRPLEEWYWKFPPQAGGRWVFLACAEDGRVLAHYGAQMVRLCVDGLAVRAGHVVDVYSVPEVRGTHVFTLCYEKFITAFGSPTNLQMIIGFPGRRHYEMGLKALNYIRLGEATYWRRSRRPSLPRLGFRAREGFDPVTAEDLWLRAQVRYPVALVRDAERLRQRYTNRPGVKYVHLTVWRRGEPHAWGVAREVEGTLRIADLVWDGREPAALAAVDYAFGRVAGRFGCTKCEMWLRGDPEAEAALARVGWRQERNPLDLLLLAREIDPRVDFDALARRGYFTMGDSDLV
ncbi:MAG: GNAT family N-acetyltransferase [Acidobacteriota bacterium]